MTSLSKQEFDEKINSGTKMILIMSAAWCGPCRAMAPTLEKLSSDLPEIEFYKTDIDEEGELTRSLGVVGVPTIFFFDGGELKYKHVGATSSGNLKKLIGEHL